MNAKNNGHIAAGNYLFECANALYCRAAIHEAWIADGRDAWKEPYSEEYLADLTAKKDALLTEAEWYQEQSGAFLNNRPPPCPDIGNRPEWFPPYQEGMTWVTDKYPDGVPAREMDLRRAWSLYA